MKQRPRIVVVGCGRHATRNIIPSLRFADMDLVALADSDEEAASRCARRLGGLRYVTDYHELLDPKEVDGAIVVVHAALHHEIAAEALRAGLHVFTEKPPSMTSDESLAVARVARESGRICMTAFKKRYAPAYVTARRIIVEEMLPGERHMEFTYNLSHYRMDDPDPAHWFLIDAGIHAIDAVRFLMGEVDELITYNSGTNGKESYAVAMRFADGSTGTLSLSARGTPGRGHELLKVTGDEKTVLVENVVHLVVHRSDGPSEMESPSYVASGNWIEATTGFAGEIQAFEEVLRTHTRPASDISSSYRSMVLYEAIRDSNGRPTCVKCEDI